MPVRMAFIERLSLVISHLSLVRGPLSVVIAEALFATDNGPLTTDNRQLATDHPWHLEVSTLVVGRILSCDLCAKARTGNVLAPGKLSVPGRIRTGLHWCDGAGIHYVFNDDGRGY